jgi:hypothetical protein
MPEIESSFYTGALDGTPQVKLDGRRFNTSVVGYNIEWTGDAAQNDTLKLFQTNPNFVPLFFVIDYTAFGGGVTLDIGTAAAEARFIAALSIATAGRTVLPVLDNTVLPAKLDIIAKFEGANPASGTLKVTLLGLAI